MLPKKNKFFKKEQEKVDRLKTCPFLIRLFYKENAQHSIEQFADGKVPAEDELHIYTWKDVTIKELAELAKEILPSAREKEATLNFRLVYRNNKGAVVMKDIGTVCSSKSLYDDRKQLLSTNFEIGDFLDLYLVTKPQPPVIQATS